MSQARSLRRQCAKCDYDLTGLASGGRCPECGSDTGPATRRDAVLLSLHRATAGICCWILLSLLAVQGMYLHHAYRMAQPRSAQLPKWWWMLAAAVVPMVAACFVALRIRRPPRRAVLWAGAVFWIAFTSLLFVGDGLDPDGAIRTYTPDVLAVAFLLTALVARR